MKFTITANFVAMASGSVSPDESALLQQSGRLHKQSPFKSDFKLYPGYAGDRKVEGWVEALYAGDTATVNYNVKGIEPECKAAPVGVANACGIHIHAGTTCDNATAVGGHYYNTTSITPDPWLPIVYTPLDTSKQSKAHGRFDVKIGKEQDIRGRAVVVHDGTGKRIACALLPGGRFDVNLQNGAEEYQVAEIGSLCAAISSEQACKDAATHFAWQFKGTESKKNRPMGCYQWSGNKGKTKPTVWFNTAITLNKIETSNRQQICSLKAMKATIAETR